MPTSALRSTCHGNQATHCVSVTTIQSGHSLCVYYQKCTEKEDPCQQAQKGSLESACINRSLHVSVFEKKQSCQNQSKGPPTSICIKRDTRVSINKKKYLYQVLEPAYTIQSGIMLDERRICRACSTRRGLKTANDTTSAKKTASAFLLEQREIPTAKAPPLESTVLLFDEKE